MFSKLGTTWDNWVVKISDTHTQMQHLFWRVLAQPSSGGYPASGSRAWCMVLFLFASVDSRRPLSLLLSPPMHDAGRPNSQRPVVERLSSSQRLAVIYRKWKPGRGVPTLPSHVSLLPRPQSWDLLFLENPPLSPWCVVVVDYNPDPGTHPAVGIRSMIGNLIRRTPPTVASAMGAASCASLSLAALAQDSTMPETVGSTWSRYASSGT